MTKNMIKYWNMMIKQWISDDFGRPYGAMFCQFAASCSAPEARVALHPSNSEEPEMASPELGHQNYQRYES